MMDPKTAHIDNNEVLVRRYQNGDEEALQLLIKVFHHRLKRTIFHYTQSYEPVDDIVQECWYVIIPKLDEIQLKISFEAWVSAIARRKAIDWVREQQHQRQKTDAMQANAYCDFQQNKTEINRQGQIDIAIQQMPPAQRIVLRMFYTEGLRLSEISEVLNVSEGTVKSRLFYAREKLKDLINP